MAGIDNLKPWEPGQSGNPDGRPLGSKNRATVLREIYKMVITTKDLDDQERPMTIEEAMMKSLIREGLNGDVPAIKEAQDTLYGKMSDKVVSTNVAMTHEEFLRQAQEQLTKEGL